MQMDGSELLVKDYRKGKSLLGLLLGRFLIFREKLVYGRLHDLPGIAHCYGTVDAYALVLQYIPARRVLQADFKWMPPDFFEALSILVERLHKRGIAHGDLHKLDNILVDSSGQPVIVDFTSVIMIGSNPLVALVFPLMCDDDWRGVCKLKAKVAPALLTEQEREFLGHRSLWERLFRRIRQPIRSLIKRWSAT